MSYDISNNYLHNIINQITDLSRNTQSQFINLLVDFLNNSNTNENLSSLPFSQSLFQNNHRLNQVLNNSLMEKKVYKKVLSDKGLLELKKIIYDENKYETKECVISMEEFNNGDEIIQLPCKHIFHSEPIKTWLKEESSKCPVCRYELDYIEIKNNKNEIISNERRDISQNRYNQMFSNMEMLYNPAQNIFRPRRQQIANQRSYVNELMGIENNYLINRNLQNAILSSLHNENSLYDSSSEEEIDIFEAFYEDEEI